MRRRPAGGWLGLVAGLGLVAALVARQPAPEEAGPGCPCGYILGSGRLTAAPHERDVGMFGLVTVARGRAGADLVLAPGLTLVVPPEGIAARQLAALEGQVVEIVVRRVERGR